MEDYGSRDIRELYGNVKPYDEGECYITIPALQRDYKWELRQINQLFDDLEEHFNNFSVHEPSKTDYFVGSVVLVKSGKDAQGRYDYELIDGQQRLITFSLIVRKTIDLYDQLLTTSDDKEGVQKTLRLLNNILYTSDHQPRLKFKDDKYQKKKCIKLLLIPITSLLQMKS